MKVKHTKNGNVKVVMPLDTAVVLRGLLLDTYKQDVRVAANLSIEEAKVLWDLEDHLDDAGVQAPWEGLGR
ncbi:hypothetical protein AWB76_07192 [Caballeronia temeraria]|uniref:Uncharacterized protein n=1 Tax=Caballeronia temeraria TaxID=1777137 RepID=A0A158DMY2_9BURK|nr:hypothetical protein [Caballeronia temeraria]SAK95770.1 hypothetical protein AWB76_07192 [Caballeronia temeraria]